MKIVLVGLPGAGKGVQGKKLAGVLGIKHVSVGELVRNLVAGSTPLGLEIRSTLGHITWSPLSDRLAAQVVMVGVEGLQSFILDGFPRNVQQAEIMRILWVPDVAIFLNVSEEVCRGRVLGRGRDGDNAEKFEVRLKAERERLPQLVEYLDSRFRCFLRNQWGSRVQPDEGYTPSPDGEFPWEKEAL